MMAAERKKASRMDDNRRMLLAIQKQTKAALDALPEMVKIRQWLDLDTAGKRYDPLKAAARNVMETLEKIALDGAAFKDIPANPTEGE